MTRRMGTICVVLLVIITGCISSSASGQATHSNPWAPTEPGPLPPVASLTAGIWLKGDLHIHSRHSKDASNNPIAKIIAFSKSAGIDYICITDHDNPKKLRELLFFFEERSTHITDLMYLCSQQDSHLYHRRVQPSGCSPSLPFFLHRGQRCFV